MTNEELDCARAEEAKRICEPHASVITTAARLAREGWTPPVAVRENTAEALHPTIADQAAEIERLRLCLKKANANHEHFERHWYLADSRIEEQAAEIERLREEIKDLMDELAYHGVYPKTRAALQPKEGEK
jgi:chromosome segregation ATPase